MSSTSSSVRTIRRKPRLQDYPWRNQRRYAMPGCELCAGAGFRLIEQGGYPAAAPCGCAAQAMIEVVCQASGLPQRFASVTLREFEPQTAAQAAARASVADWITLWHANGRSPGSLYLCGPVGTGKTHCACAAMRALAARQVWGAYCSTSDLLMALRATMAKGSEDGEEDVLDPYCDVPLLVLDDIGVEKLSDWGRDRLHVLVDRRYTAELPTIYTSNLAPEALGELLDPHTASRILGGTTVVMLDGPDYRQKAVA